jgi:hypothetical protein
MCLGDCPAYVITIFAVGRVTYEGSDMFMAPDGKLGPEELSALKRRFDGARYFDLCDAIERKWKDHPSIYLDHWDGQRHKRVRTDLSPAQYIAPEVRELANAVDLAVDRARVVREAIERRPAPAASANPSASPKARKKWSCDPKDPLCGEE